MTPGNNRRSLDDIAVTMTPYVLLGVEVLMLAELYYFRMH